MTYRVQVHRPLKDAGDYGHVDRLVVNSPSDVVDTDGVLLITIPAQDARDIPLPVSMGDKTRTIPASRSSIVAYPRGGWTKVVVTDVVDEDES